MSTAKSFPILTAVLFAALLSTVTLKANANAFDFNSGSSTSPFGNSLKPDKDCNQFIAPSSDDAVSKFMCGADGGKYLGPSSQASKSTLSPIPASPSTSTSTSTSTLFNTADANCNRFIVPASNDALSSLMCGPGGGSYLLMPLVNLPVVPSLPVKPNLPSVKPTVIATEPKVAVSPVVTFAKPNPGQSADKPPVISATPTPIAEPSPTAISPSTQQAPTPTATQPATEQTSNQPILLIVIGAVVLVFLVGALLYISGGSSNSEK